MAILKNYNNNTSQWEPLGINGKINVEVDDNYLLNKIYPVGSIYISVSSASPASFLGGTWEKIEDRFLLACGQKYLAGSKGGEENHSHGLSSGFADIMVGSRGLRVRETVRHTFSPSDKASLSGYETDSGTSDWAAQLSGATDLGNNMPPYLAVNMWKRTA